MKNSAKLITLEGVDGAGKSTHIEFIQSYFLEKKIKFIMTREPGGTVLGEKLREILLYDLISPNAETLLMFAARSEHLDKIILPNLKQGITVVCDRFTDSTYAYQSGGKFVDKEKISILKKWTHKNLTPDVTLLFDLPVEVSMTRLNNTRILDKFEQGSEEFHMRIRQTYLQLAKNEKERFRVIDSSQSIENVENKIRIILEILYK